MLVAECRQTVTWLPGTIDLLMQELYAWYNSCCCCCCCCYCCCGMRHVLI